MANEKQTSSMCHFRGAPAQRSRRRFWTLLIYYRHCLSLHVWMQRWTVSKSPPEPEFFFKSETQVSTFPVLLGSNDSNEHCCIESKRRPVIQRNKLCKIMLRNFVADVAAACKYSACALTCLPHKTATTDIINWVIADLWSKHLLILILADSDASLLESL